MSDYERDHRLDRIESTLAGVGPWVLIFGVWLMWLTFKIAIVAHALGLTGWWSPHW